MKSNYLKKDEYSLSGLTFFSSIKLLNDTIEQQSQQLKELNEKYVNVSSQLQSQAELLREK